MLAGPLDYPPGIFNITWFPEQSPEDPNGESNDGTRVHTARAPQIALYPVLLSGYQQLADVPKHHREAPEFEFLREVPVIWDETRVLQGRSAISSPSPGGAATTGSWGPDGRTTARARRAAGLPRPGNVRRARLLGRTGHRPGQESQRRPDPPVARRRRNDRARRDDLR